MTRGPCNLWVMEEQVGPAFRLKDYIRTYKLRVHVTSRVAPR